LSLNLIDVTETLASKTALYFRRVDDNELFIQLKSGKLEYNLSVILKQDYEMLYFSNDLNLKNIPKEKHLAVVDAIAKANERIWVGHFDLISTDNRIVFSLTIPCISSFFADENVIESIIQLVIDECDRFYHYFSMIIENRESIDSSINSLFLESAGEA
jgi:hypothetical protein